MSEQVKNQDIRFKRNRTVYPNRAAVIAALDATIVQKTGQPLLHMYLDGDKTQGLLTLGIGDGTGKACYKIMADEVVIEDATRYSNDEPIVTPIGQIKAGETFEDVPLKEMITRILYPYVAPVVTCSTSPTGGLKHKGTTVNNVVVTASVTKKSKKITNVKILKDGATVQEFTDEILTGSAQKQTTVATVNANCTFKASASDGESTITSGGVTFQFVNPYYIGILDASVANPTSEQITNLEEILAIPGNVSKNFASIASQRVCIALPAGWVLKSIIDPNGFDITASYTKKTISVTTKTGGVTENYNVYVSDVFSASNFTIKYNR